jgi:hypothetical protein
MEEDDDGEDAKAKGDKKANFRTASGSSSAIFTKHRFFSLVFVSLRM